MEPIKMIICSRCGKICPQFGVEDICEDCLKTLDKQEELQDYEPDLIDANEDDEYDEDPDYDMDDNEEEEEDPFELDLDDDLFNDEYE